MVLFCAAFRRDLFFLLRFPFLSHIQVFLSEILFVCLSKYPWSFPSHFCFLVISVLLMPVLSVLFLVAVISFPPRLLRRWIDSSMLSYLPSFLNALLLLLLLLFDLQFYFRFLTIIYQVFTRNPGWESVIIICILCTHVFASSGWCFSVISIIFSQRDE